MRFKHGRLTLKANPLAAILFATLCTLTLTDSVSAQSKEDVAQLGDLMKQLQQHNQNNEQAKAADVLGELETLGGKLLGTNNPGVIGMGIGRALALRALGEYDKALQQAIISRQKALEYLGKDHFVFGKALITIGSIYRMKADFENAKANYREGIRRLEAAGESGQKDLADGYTNYADLLAQINDPVAARRYNHKAIDLNTELFGVDSIQVANVQSNLAVVLISLGEMDAAEKTLKQSLKINEQFHGPDHPEIVPVLNNQGLLYTKRWKYAEAETAYRRAIKIAKEKLGNKNALTLKTTSNLGQLLSETGKHAEAQILLKQAVKLSNEILGPNHPSTANALHNLGTDYADVQDFENGRNTLNQAATIWKIARGDRHPDTAGTFAYLGILETADNKALAAIAAFQQARTIANNSAWDVLPKLGSNEQQNFMRRTFNWTLHSSLALAEQNPNNQSVLQSTAMWLANGKGIPETALAAARTGSTDQQLKQVSLEEVRNAIPKDGVLIDIARHDFIDYNAQSLKDRLLDPHYVAWITPPQGDVVRVDLGDATMIDEQVEAAREAIKDAGGEGGTIETRGEADATKIVRNQLAKLAGMIWKPLSPHIGAQTDRLIISPDSQLWLVPWSALPTEATEAGGQWLIERYAISTTASGRELVTGNRSDQPNKAKPTIFSNPEFDQSSSGKASSYQRLFKHAPQKTGASLRKTSPDNRSGKTYDQSGQLNFRVAPLPGTDREAKAISPAMQIWLDGLKPDNFRGPYALESVAKQLVRPRTLVFATHGFSASAGKGRSDVDPLANCGLLMAGCNNKRSEILGDDGILTGVEIAAIDLRSTELVVLSACETGIGKIENGNGVAGLRRAFHLAGAECVASTLWRISDVETPKLMSHFFESLAKKTDKDLALQTAQVERINALRKQSGVAHPYYWASFGISAR